MSRNKVYILQLMSCTYEPVEHVPHYGPAQTR